MENFLSRFVGKRIDVYCGGSASLRGDVIKVENGVLHLRDSENKSCYIAVDKIVVVWEAKDDTHRAGFTPSMNKD
ncbi:MAG TPA: MM0924 family protein [Pyrinomonadaceae bacterium]